MTTVLVAGATGMLGSRIASNLLDQDGVAVRLLVRSDWDLQPAKTERVAPLLSRGATVAVGDVTDPQTLDSAVANSDVVVSALQGGDDIIVEGQLALARAAVANGARRFLPSDFAIDLFHAPAGPPQFQARLRADAAIDQLDLQVLHILNGGFMDQMLDPAHPGLVDVAAGTVSFWGTGDELIDLTTVEDTATFTARVATDPGATPGVHTISGAPASFRQIADEVSKATGVTMNPTSWGSMDQLREVIAAKGGAGSWAAVMEWYFLATLTTPPLTGLANARYHGLAPTGLNAYVQQAYATA